MNQLQRKFMITLVVCFYSVTGLLQVLHCSKPTFHDLLHGIHTSVFNYLKSAGFGKKFLIQLTFQLVLLLLLYLTLLNKILKFLTAILLFTSIDMTLLCG